MNYESNNPPVDATGIELGGTLGINYPMLKSLVSVHNGRVCYQGSPFRAGTNLNIENLNEAIKIVIEAFPILSQPCMVGTRASIENTSKGIIDMNTVANYELKFQSTTFHPVVDGGHIWLTSTELARALEYADAKSITKIFSRNQDEFTPAMSKPLNAIRSFK